MVTLEDVSKHAGVSTATVSRVMNRSPLVTPNTRTRVEQAIKDLNYTPCFAARTLAKQSTDTLGVIFPDIASGFYAEVLKGIDVEAYYAGYHLMVAFSHGRQDEQDIVLDYLNSRRVDGLIIMNLTLSDNFVRSLSADSIPIVFLDRPVAKDTACSVTLDNVDGAKLAMNHLIQDHNYRKIAVITGPKETYDAEQRLLGCRMAVDEAGMQLDNQYIWHGDFSEESGYKAIDLWLRTGRPLPEAIFAFSDLMAVGALDCLREHGLRVPEDIAVIGCDDIPLAHHLGLTTVHLPMEQMGRLAVSASLNMIRGVETPMQQILKTDLVVRKSCGCAERKNFRR